MQTSFRPRIKILAFFGTLNPVFNSFPSWYVWFDGVGGAVLVAIGGFVLNRFWRKSHKTVEKQGSLVMNETVGNAVSTGSITDSQVAAGSNITQTSVIHHHYSPVDKPETEFILTHPDPLEIVQSLDGLPPFDLIHACEKFKGLRVLWRIIFSNLSNSDDSDTWCVSGTFPIPPLGRSVSVAFLLSPPLPPELKVAKRNTPIWVRGTVKKVWYPIPILLEDNPELLRIEHSSKALD